MQMLLSVYFCLFSLVKLSFVNLIYGPPATQSETLMWIEKRHPKSFKGLTHPTGKSVPSTGTSFLITTMKSSATGSSPEVRD